jgi:hypothetical protein
MQKAFPGETVGPAVGTLPDLFAPNLRTVLNTRIAAIVTRINIRKLNEGISHFPIGLVVTSSIGISG